jgi:membrane protease YdiL (CAAX protease family)
MNLSAIDHIFALILTAALPLLSYWDFRRLLARVEAGVENARLRAYLTTIAKEWTLTAVVVTAWAAMGRSLSELGLRVETGVAGLIGWGLALGASALLAMQTIMALRSSEALSRVREQLGPLEEILPRDRTELRAFSALSITAGICEELLYRGYFIAYLNAIFGIWPAVFLSSAAFGLGHSYQGLKGVIKTGGIGLVMAGLYLLAGSLWAPVLLHAVIDLNSGYLGRRAILDLKDH